MQSKYFIYYLLFTLAITQLSGCATAVVGGVTTGVAVVHDRRTTGIIIDDQEIELRAFKLKYDHPDIVEHSNISITSYNLIVLLTGQAESQEVVAKLADLISKMPRVRKIHNEVFVGAEATLSESTSDTYLTSRAKLALFNLDLPNFDPTRIKIITSQGTVYLLGLVTHQEAETVSDKIRFISGVKHVVKVFEYIDS